MRDDDLKNFIMTEEQLKNEDQSIFESKNFQYYRDNILELFKNTPYKVKFNIIKKIDKTLLSRINRRTGTKKLHTLDYWHKLPSRKKDLTKFEEMMLILRFAKCKFALDDFTKEEAKKKFKNKFRVID